MDLLLFLETFRGSAIRKWGYSARDLTLHMSVVEKAPVEMHLCVLFRPPCSWWETRAPGAAGSAPWRLHGSHPPLTPTSPATPLRPSLSGGWITWCSHLWTGTVRVHRPKEAIRKSLPVWVFVWVLTGRLLTERFCVFPCNVAKFCFVVHDRPCRRRCRTLCQDSLKSQTKVRQVKYQIEYVKYHFYCHNTGTLVQYMWVTFLQAVVVYKIYKYRNKYAHK